MGTNSAARTTSGEGRDTGPTRQEIPTPRTPKKFGLGPKKSWKERRPPWQYGYDGDDQTRGISMSVRVSVAALGDIQKLFDWGAMGAWTDSQLVERFLAGREESEAAFRVLIQRHGPMVLGICRRILGDEHAAEDAFQATFLTLVKKARGLRDRGLLTAWLYGVATRVSHKERARGGALAARRASCGRAGTADRRLSRAGRPAVTDRRGDSPAAGAVPGAAGPLPRRRAPA